MICLESAIEQDQIFPIDVSEWLNPKPACPTEHCVGLPARMCTVQCTGRSLNGIDQPQQNLCQADPNLLSALLLAINHFNYKDLNLQVLE
jgi:hypothetical protein